MNEEVEQVETEEWLDIFFPDRHVEAEMNINYTYRHETREWVATLDSYDGAPDARPCDRSMGFGDTQEEAKQDLLYALEGFTA